MGYADGYYYGQGRIICDTSTFSVGDTIRVRSMTDSSKVWNQQVATVGTALVFTVPPYDYYKICTVQTIDNTPTEIGGVYKTVDYGQTLFIGDLFEHETLAGVQKILNAHQEDNVLQVGDRAYITISDEKIPCILVAKNRYADHEAIFAFEYSTTQVGEIHAIYYQRSNLLSYLNNLYTNTNLNDKPYIKLKNVYAQYLPGGQCDNSVNAYFWEPTRQEIFGDCANEANGGNKQFQYYITQTNRQKKMTGTLASINWQTASNTVTNLSIANDYVTQTGTLSGAGSGTFYVVPHFRLTADI